jgi:hypothetical protein
LLGAWLSTQTTLPGIHIPENTDTLLILGLFTDASYVQSSYRVITNDGMDVAGSWRGLF